MLCSVFSRVLRQPRVALRLVKLRSIASEAATSSRSNNASSTPPLRPNENADTTTSSSAKWLDQIPEESFVFKDATIDEVLAEKKTIRQSVLEISASSLVFDAIKKMNDCRVGALLVRADDNTICGILTERDYLTKVALRGLDSRKTRVSQIMSKELVYAKTTDHARNCLRLMTERRFRHLPVIDTEKQEVRGMVSIGDLVKTSISRLTDTVSYLRDFVQGRFDYSYSATERPGDADQNKYSPEIKEKKSADEDKTL